MLVEVRDLTKVFPLGESAWGGRAGAELRAVDGVSLAIANTALATGNLPAGVSFSDLTTIIDQLNSSFDNCQQSDWAKIHLVAGSS